jgi:tRNA dimethylallyltransferase
MSLAWNRASGNGWHPQNHDCQSLSDSVEPAPKIVCVVGPTAVGKSRLALHLAKSLGGEILSADSRQVYRYMDIGTDKPSPIERASVRHHLIDVVSPAERYSAQRFAAEARAVLRRLGHLGVPAIVAGGTGFYFRTLLDAPGLPRVAPDPELRARLYGEADERSGSALHARLAQSDPASAARIHPNNLPRLIRALEIVESTGRPVPPMPNSDPVPALWIGVDMDRDRLRVIADDRIRRQVERGLLEETRLLLAMGFDPSLPALQGFGYREMVQVLRGALSLEAATRLYQAATHRYIRRQLTWFRPDRRIHWLPADVDLPSRALELAQSWIEGQTNAYLRPPAR